MKDFSRRNFLDKQTQEAAMKDQRFSTNETNVGRREFIKTAGLAAVALGAGFGASRAFAQEASTYTPVTSNYMQVHKDMLIIDGTTNLTGLDKNADYLDWYKEDGATCMVMTISAANMVAASNVRHKDDTLDGLGFIHRLLQTRDDLLLVRSASDIETAKQTGKLALFLQFQNAAVVENNLDLVNMYKALGINIMGMAYNQRNQFANGVTEPVDGGLSTLGVKLIERLNEAKIIIDVAHTGTQSGLQTVAASNSPVVLSTRIPGTIARRPAMRRTS
ncbi:MAG: membrane dipeptidase [Roseobacter sp.]